MPIDRDREQEARPDSERAGPARHLLASARHAAQAGDLSAAQAAYEQALAADPDLQEAWLALAALTPDSLFARALYERILQKWPGCAEAHETLARLNAEARGSSDAFSRLDDRADGLDAAKRAGASLYRGPHGRGGELDRSVEIDYQGDDAPGILDPAPRCLSQAPARGTGPWLSLLLVLAALALVSGAALLWRDTDQAAAKAQPLTEQALPNKEAPVRRQSPGPQAATALHPWARRHLLFLPVERWIEIGLVEGALTAHEGQVAVRVMPVGAPRPLSTGHGPGADRWRADVLTAGAFDAAHAWIYAVDLAPEDARWLATWLGPRGLCSGQLLVTPGRIVIPLD